MKLEKSKENANLPDLELSSDNSPSAVNSAQSSGEESEMSAFEENCNAHVNQEKGLVFSKQVHRHTYHDLSWDEPYLYNDYEGVDGFELEAVEQRTKHETRSAVGGECDCPS